MVKRRGFGGAELMDDDSDLPDILKGPTKFDKKSSARADGKMTSGQKFIEAAGKVIAPAETDLVSNGAYELSSQIIPLQKNHRQKIRHTDVADYIKGPHLSGDVSWAADTESEQWVAFEHAVSEYFAGKDAEDRKIAEYLRLARFACAFRSPEDLLHPVSVYQEHGKLKQISGLRRLLAHILREFSHIHVIHRTPPKDDLELLRVAFLENKDREDVGFAGELAAAEDISLEYQNQFDDTPSVRQLSKLMKLSHGTAQTISKIISLGDHVLIQFIYEQGYSISGKAALVLATKYSTEDRHKLLSLIRIARADDEDPEAFEITTTLINNVAKALTVVTPPVNVKAELGLRVRKQDVGPVSRIVEHLMTMPGVTAQQRKAVSKADMSDPRALIAAWNTIVEAVTEK